MTYNVKFNKGFISLLPLMSSILGLLFISCGNEEYIDNSLIYDPANWKIISKDDGIDVYFNKSNEMRIDSIVIPPEGGSMCLQYSDMDPDSYCLSRYSAALDSLLYGCSYWIGHDSSIHKEAETGESNDLIVVELNPSLKTLRMEIPSCHQIENFNSEIYVVLIRPQALSRIGIFLRQE